MFRVMRQRKEHTSVQREPGLQQSTTPGVRTLLWLLTQRVASAFSVLVRMLRPGAWLAGALRSLQSVFATITTVMYPKRRHLLAWVRAQLPTREIADLSAVWRDGGLLCALVETAVSPDPRLCCRLAKYRGANTPSLRLGQRLAAEYLQVPPAFTEAELERSPTPSVISRLADYLTALKHASQKLHEQKYEKVSPYLPKFVAKGMGLFMAVKGRNATFSVFPSGRRTLFPTLGIGPTSLTIIIKGPDRECERIEVTPRGAQAKPKSESCCRIPISVITSTEACRVTYKPQSIGQHKVFLQYQEINLAHSPYRVNVEAANVLPETPVRNEKIRNMRVVDFIDEKHILTETGKLIPLPKETPSLPLNINKNITFKGRVKHVVARRKLIGSKKSKHKSIDDKGCSPTNEKILEKHSSTDSKTDFKDTCKRILSVCDFLLKSKNKSKTLNIINTAEQILSSSPDLIKRNLCPKKSVQFNDNDDKNLLINEENSLTEDEDCTNKLPMIFLCHRGSEPIEIHRKGCNLSELDRIVSVPFDLKNSSPRKVLDTLNRNTKNKKEPKSNDSDDVIQEEKESLLSKDTTVSQNFSKIEKGSEFKLSENEESMSDDIAIDVLHTGFEEETMNDVLENFEAPSYETKVKEWMGPAEREIWENELRWYEEVGEDLVGTSGEIETMPDVQTRNITDEFEQENIINLIDDKNGKDEINCQISEQGEMNRFKNLQLTDIFKQSYQEATKILRSSVADEQNDKKEEMIIRSYTSSPESNFYNRQEGSENINATEANLYEEISKEIFDDTNLDAQYLEILKSYEEYDEFDMVNSKLGENREESQTETYISNNNDTDSNVQNINNLKNSNDSLETKIAIDSNVETNVLDSSHALGELLPKDSCKDNHSNYIDNDAIEMESESKQLKSKLSFKENIEMEKLDFNPEIDEIQGSAPILNTVDLITENTVAQMISLSDTSNLSTNINNIESSKEIESESFIRDMNTIKEFSDSSDEEIVADEKNDIVTNELEMSRENKSPRPSTDSVVDATRRLSLSLCRLSSIQDEEPLRVPEFLQLLSHTPDIASIGSSRVITPIDAVEIESPNVYDSNKILNRIALPIEIDNNGENLRKNENITNNVNEGFVKDNFENSTSVEMLKNDILNNSKSVVVSENFKKSSKINQQEIDSNFTTAVVDNAIDKTTFKSNVVNNTIPAENEITKTAENVEVSQPNLNANNFVKLETPKNQLLSESNGHDSLTCILEELERERNLHHSNENSPDLVQRERRSSLVMKRKQFWDKKISESSIDIQQTNERSRKNSTENLYFANVAHATPTLTPTPDLTTSRPSSPFIPSSRKHSTTSKSLSPISHDSILIDLNTERLNNITQQIINFEKKESPKSSTNVKPTRKYSKSNIFQTKEFLAGNEVHPIKRSAALSVRLKHDSSSCDDADSEHDNKANDVTNILRPSTRNHDQMLFKRGSLSMKRDSLRLKRNSDLKKHITQEFGDLKTSSSSKDLDYRNNLMSNKKDSNSQIEIFEKESNDSFEQRTFESMKKIHPNSPKRVVSKSKHFANVSAKFESFSNEEKQPDKKKEVKRTVEVYNQKDVLKKVENKFYSVGKMIMTSNSIDIARIKQHFTERRIKSYEEGGRNEESQDGNEFHSIKYTTTPVKVAIVPSRRNSKASMRPTLLSQFSLEITPDLSIETSSVNPLCDMVDAQPKAEPEVEDSKTLETVSVNPTIDMVDSEPKAEKMVKTNKKPKVTSEESRDRFESAKNFFKSLEKGVAVDKTTTDPKIRRLSESARIARKNVEPAVHFSSVRQPRLAERFHVKDLFRDIIEDKAVNARGIPNREAAVASLNSVSVPPLLPAVVTKPFSRIIEDSLAEIF